MTGPIQPLPIPNVAPGYYEGAPNSVDIIHRGIKSLVDVLLAKQQQDFEQQKLNEATAQRMQQQQTDQQTGDLLQQLLPSLARPSVPGGTIAPNTGPRTPYSTGMIAPVTVQQDNTATRLSSAFAGKPGTAITKAAGIAANSIQQAIARENPKPEPTHFVTDEQGQLVGVAADRQGSLIYYHGTQVPIKLKDVITDKGTVFNTGANDKAGHPIYVWSKTGETVKNEDLAAAVRAVSTRGAGAGGGSLIEPAKALQFYTMGMTAYHATKDLPPLHTNLADMYGTLALIGGPDVESTPASIRRWYAQNGMSAADRNRIEATIPLVQALGHSMFGARFPMSSALQVMQSIIPWENDPDGSNGSLNIRGPGGVKDRQIQAGLMGLHEKAAPAIIQTEKRTGQHIVDPYNDLHWNVGSALDPQAWGLPTPGDPVNPDTGIPIQNPEKNPIIRKFLQGQKP